MSWFFAPFYDRFMRASEEACLISWRKELLAKASGKTLEIGAGTGANLDSYPAHIQDLTLLEPDNAMRGLLEKRIASGSFKATICANSATELPFPDNHFDTVLCTLVLCSIPDQHRALQEIKRVLKPGGCFLFLEHGAAPEDSSRLNWQRRLEPLWKIFAGGCRLTRRADKDIEGSGLIIEEIQRESMRKALPITRPTVRGLARKAL
ncbi:MAG: class I SAM-dependent methyltransferase [Planctomycetota bacterium]|nr:class I SAM-dependent methyltransferase [Planctomycetota bacterium]